VLAIINRPIISAHGRRPSSQTISLIFIYLFFHLRPFSVPCIFAFLLDFLYFLFIFQFVVGFFSFMILLCCEGATGAFRAALVPVHGTAGLTIFMMGVATAVTGLTEKAIFSLKLVLKVRIPHSLSDTPSCLPYNIIYRFSTSRIRFSSYSFTNNEDERRS
jgi:hypothetical protein